MQRLFSWLQSWEGGEREGAVANTLIEYILNNFAL